MSIPNLAPVAPLPEHVRNDPDACRYCRRYGKACGRPHPPTGTTAATFEPGRALSADDLAVILRALDARSFDLTGADHTADDGAEAAAARRVREHLAPLLVTTPIHGIPLALVRIDTDPHRRPEGRVTEFAYGGMECCEDRAAYVVTRTNSLDTRRYTVCSEHKSMALKDAPLYVDGWGTSTTTVARIDT